MRLAGVLRMNVTVRRIKEILGSHGISARCNVYADEPTPSFHCVAVEKGKGNLAISVLLANGLDAMWVPGCSHIYADNIQVGRTT